MVLAVQIKFKRMMKKKLGATPEARVLKITRYSLVIETQTLKKVLEESAQNTILSFLRET